MLYLVNIPGFGLQIGHLQDALQELRDSVKVSLQQAAGEREQYVAQVNAKAAADKTLYEVCSPVLALALLFQHDLRTGPGSTGPNFVSAFLTLEPQWKWQPPATTALVITSTCYIPSMLPAQQAGFGKSHTIHALWQRGIACAPGKGHSLAAYTDSATRGPP